ncbi:MAG TPA: HYR domain-containing protein [Blastocatellia bacterium]|nr:HYR domain-containing protein [Blastocatellia bacterium]
MKNKVTSKRIQIFVLVVVAWMVLASVPGLRRVSANSYTVTNLNDSGAGSFRQAILDANANAGADTIDFQPGLTGTITLTTGELAINDSLQIQGPGALRLEISGNDASRVFNLSGAITVSLSGLTISHGNSAATGGGIFSSGNGTLNLTACAIRDNQANGGNGGGLDSPSVNLTMSGCTMSGNSATGGGGALSIGNGSVTIANCTFSRNSAATGGAINSNFAAASTVDNSTITQNAATSGDGGGISITGGPFNLHSSLVANNTATGAGPDIFGSLSSGAFNLIRDPSGNNAATGTHTITGVDPLVAPLAYYGGQTATCMLLAGSPAIDRGANFGTATDQRGVGFSRTVDDPAVANPNSDGTDIGAFERQSTELPDATLVVTTLVDEDNGTADPAQGTGTSLREAIHAANASGSNDVIYFAVTGKINLGGGMLFLYNPIQIQGPGADVLTVQRSMAAGTPAFSIFYIQYGLPATLSGLTIANGQASPGNVGGGITNLGNLTINNCTISGNSAPIGGGILNFSVTVPVTLTVNNSTISGNSANGNVAGGFGNGGGIASFAYGQNIAATVVVNNSTISGNSANGNGGGIDNLRIQGTATVKVNNSTIADNSAGLAGGGLSNNSGTVNIKNSIIANSPLGGNCANTAGTFSATGVNYSTDATCPGFTQVTSAQLNLGPLQVNAPGTTATHALLPGSVAIDAVTDCTDVAGNAVAADQRGVARPLDGDGDGTARCDAGAYEAPTCSSSGPAITCPGNLTVTANSGCTYVGSIGMAGASDPCSLSVTISNDAPSAFPIGQTVVTWKATNAVGRFSTCQQVITVTDGTAPTISSKSLKPQSATTDAKCQASVPDVRELVRAQSADNCTAQAQLVITQDPAAGSAVSGTGSHPITVMVKDAAGNLTSCAVAFTVTDNTPPSITCPANITTATDAGSCSATVKLATAQASDNCGVQSITGTRSDGQALNAAYPKGMTTITWKATDTSGNQSTCQQIVTVNDTQPPQLTCPANITAVAPLTCPLSTARAVSYTLPAVSDNCPGASVVCTPPSGAVFAVGTTSVTCTATDASGNTARCGFAVTVWTACVQDDSNLGNVCLFNAQTGEYQFCCNGMVAATGTGVLTVRGCTLTINQTKGERRVSLSADLSQKRGSATVFINGQATCQITDRDMTNNLCQCPLATVAAKP